MGSWFSDRPRLNLFDAWHLNDGRESCDVGLKGDLFRGIRLSEQLLYYIKVSIVLFLSSSRDKFTLL